MRPQEAIDPEGDNDSITREQAVLTTFAAGHGDCTLLEYSQHGGNVFRILIDAGRVLLHQLVKHISDSDRPIRLDLLLLSPVDDDHLGGLAAAVDDFEIGEYWGPCLPAFRRYAWLFGRRVSDAIGRAAALAGQLRARKFRSSIRWRDM